MLANISIPLVGAVDTAVMGRLPDEVYIGAVAIGAVIFNFLYWGFGFLRMGTTGFISQAYGSGNYSEVSNAICRALLLGGAMGMVLIILQWPLGILALWFFEGSEELESLALQYFSIRIWSAPAALIQYAVLGFLIGLQRTPAVLGLQLLLNGTNVILDIVFVIGFGWGVQGVAFATLISEYLAAGVGLFLVYRGIKRLTGHIDSRALLDREAIKALFNVNANIFIRTLCLILAFSYFTAQGTLLGETTLAANTILMHMLGFIAYGLDGFAHAVETLGGNAYGARDSRAFRIAVMTSTQWAGIAALFNALIFFLLGPTFIGWMTTLDHVHQEALVYLPWVVLSPLLSVWSFQLDGIYIGTTFTKEMRNGMLISLALYLCAVWMLAPVLGNHGLWLALMVFFIIRAVTLGIWFPRIGKSMHL